MVARRQKPLRIVFLAPTPPPVMGPSIATQIVLAEPPPAGVELVHIDTADRRSLATLGRIDLANLGNALGNAARLLAVIVRRRPQLVYIPISQTPIGYLRDTLYLLIAWLFRRRIALHLRGGDFTEFYDGAGFLLRAWIRWTLRRASAILVLGECLRPMFTRFVPERRVHVVPNGEDFPEFAGWHRDFGRRRGCHVVYLGNLVPLKGAGDVLRAAPAILRRHPSTRFTLAGEWRSAEFQEWSERFARERGLERCVRFLGPVDRAGKTALLREADLFVLPSSREGHPWVIVEALAAGLPVVSCDVGCVRESVQDGENGYLVPPGDPEALARAVSRVLEDPALRQRMSQESRRRYEHRFTRGRFRHALFDALRAAGARPAAAAEQAAGAEQAVGAELAATAEQAAAAELAAGAEQAAAPEQAVGAEEEPCA